MHRTNLYFSLCQSNAKTPENGRCLEYVTSPAADADAAVEVHNFFYFRLGNMYIPVWPNLW